MTHFDEDSGSCRCQKAESAGSVTNFRFVNPRVMLNRQPPPKCCTFSRVFTVPTMDESMYTEDELRLTTERSRKYQGTAKINISQIALHPSVSQHSDQKNVERLCEIFDKEGCRRLDVYNHVSAVVSRQHLHDALRAARVSTNEMMTNQPNRYPHLQFSAGQVECLHGQHRLKAGEEYLSPIDQWWAVDLYLDGK